MNRETNGGSFTPEGDREEEINKESRFTEVAGELHRKIKNLSTALGRDRHDRYRGMAEASSKQLSDLPDELTDKIKKDREYLLDNIEIAFTWLEENASDKLDQKVISDSRIMIDELRKL